MATQSATPTFPIVVYNLKWRVPPMVIKTLEQLDALDPAEWTTNPPQPAPKGGPQDQQYPQIYYDINTAFIVVNSADDLATIDTSRYKPLPLSQAIVTAAQANITAAASA